MKKAISMAMAAAMVLSTGITTVPVMADEKTELTIWSPADKQGSRLSVLFFRQPLPVL